MWKRLPLSLALAGVALAEPYDPNFLMNAGMGFFTSGSKAVEVSEWINVSKATGWHIGRKASALWVGFDQGYYLSAPGRLGYLEIQLATLPAGISAGVIRNEDGSSDWKGSLWLSAPFIINFTGSIGFETSDPGERSQMNLGAFIKVPIFACCGVFGMP